MAKRIRKEERLSADRPAALGELIHAQVRVAIEAAVHEELAIALGAGRYERHSERRRYRNGVKPRTLTGPTGRWRSRCPGPRWSRRPANGARRSCRAINASGALPCPRRCAVDTAGRACSP
jgi:Transposase, Mutator family